MRKNIAFKKDLQKDWDEHTSYGGDFDNCVDETVLKQKEYIKSRTYHNEKRAQEKAEMEEMRLKL